MQNVTETKVTKVGNKYVAKLIVNGKPWAQIWVSSKLQIGLACKELLRTFDKMGGNSMSDSSRHRNKENNHRSNDLTLWSNGTKFEWLS